MEHYNTKKKQMIIDFMTKHREKSLSIDEWLVLMKSENVYTKLPARSTLFRQIQMLVEEKKVIRSSTSNKTTKYCIASCLNIEDHLHLKCLICGDLVHISRNISNSFMEIINSDYNFYVSTTESIIYGRCGSCTKVD